MPFHPELSITGLQEAQQRNLRQIAALQPRGALGEAVQWATTEAHRRAVAYTHVDTGSLRASHRIELSGVRGRVYIDPSATNPRSGTPPAEYGVYEHRRGGGHAFYDQVLDNDGQDISRRMNDMVRLGVERA